MKWLFILPIRLYKRFISKGLATNCPYKPTCAVYALQSLDERGALLGLWLSIARVLRCNPWTKGGVDKLKRSYRRNVRFI